MDFIKWHRRKLLDALANVTTATLTTVLLKKGLRNVWLRGTKPLRPGQKRVVGPAFSCDSCRRVRIWRRRLLEFADFHPCGD